MFSKYWQVIRDDSKKTFEICGQETNTNLFTNTTAGMQKVGMNVTCLTLPVTNKTAAKENVKIVGYTKEDGLYERLTKQYRDIMMRSVDDW
ncbi:MAG TPA: hypothetical protein DGG95_11455 [Cytophagales bacterium]|jgi:hypothetical protein|nr:hypothetical protein [Cytophagales bacterium]